VRHSLDDYRPREESPNHGGQAANILKYLLFST